MSLPMKLRTRPAHRKMTASGTKQTSPSVPHMTASGGKADIRRYAPGELDGATFEDLGPGHEGSWSVAAPTRCLGPSVSLAFPRAWTHKLKSTSALVGIVTAYV